MDIKDVRNRFTYHQPTPEKAQIHNRVRTEIGELAELIEGLVPDGREKSLAMTHLEEAMFWSNAAIARN